MVKPWLGHRGRSGGWGMATVVRGMFSYDPNKVSLVQRRRQRIRDTDIDIDNMLRIRSRNMFVPLSFRNHDQILYT